MGVVSRRVFGDSFHRLVDRPCHSPSERPDERGPLASINTWRPKSAWGFLIYHRRFPDSGKISLPLRQVDRGPACRVRSIIAWLQTSGVRERREHSLPGWRTLPPPSTRKAHAQQGAGPYHGRFTGAPRNSTMVYHDDLRKKRPGIR